ncbi:AcrR family transcriptional regulator [Cytobacillus horneckiae]|uniref:TetR/AcrR family transcriptional regulator n=1 Tax=Cytobacillus horneckiae TaxID=549687 RepID=A0A2N0ZMJ9_9BACI|nr:TetR family transcriptional regulator [Cytobacillus horneckiae]MBN6886285.1 TetR family transcriptional regulator [Cytobacillus horneckiae]MCM3176526.1 TetR family transcriptional regulator [Cytobacillus horneckiae]MEC1159143.1 TetR family transcriptional regulator [Cytobacillus horneckiae]MED2938835.1 TetR family transcriptional regulator [Cytobacillus horneckiae]PKG30751.1 TetR/AcrR family transcriptional regulator [Cytobacillus horneckiae]
MPKITFFNLPHEKQKKLVHAARQEFSRVPLYQASITNIVKSARIPRGSFYQYFEDKEDAFFYLLKERVQVNKNYLFSLIKRHEGDIFQTLIDFYKLIITEEEENLSFLRNIFLNMNHQIETEFERSFSNHEANEEFSEFSSLIDKDKLNIKNDEEFACMMKILISVMMRSVIDKFSRDLTEDEAMRHFNIEMNLLKNGLSMN